MNKTLDYFNGNELAANIWSSKYALRLKGKQIESSPEEMHKRMAVEFARIESKFGGLNQMDKEEIFEHFDEFGEIIPQGSVMAILGNPNSIGSLSNCIVTPKIHDSYGGILYTDQQLVQLMKRRCGVGIDISTLRPAGSSVSNAAQSSTGAVSFMHRFSNSTREVAQGGRRGALMITMDIRHPEAEEFTLVKQDLSKVTGANISLKLTDEFMRAVQEEGDFFQRFPIDIDNIPYIDGLTRKNGVGFDPIEYPYEYNKLTSDLYTEAKFKRIKAKVLWNTIVGAAHKSAEPGLIFWDKQHRYSPSSLYPEFENISTNPCSEIAMGFDSCRLISINIFSCVGEPFTSKAVFDFENWYWLNYNGMRLMDDLVELELEAIGRIIDKINSDKEPEYIKVIERETWLKLHETGRRGRRTGLGFTALGDTLAALGMRYGSEESIEFVNELMRVKLSAELDSTMDLAEERGAFPAFDAELEDKYAEESDTYFYMLKNEFPDHWQRMQKVGRRNISWSTVAPNGSLSPLAKLIQGYYGVTSGIEPLFSVYHIRRKKINANDDNTRVDFVDELGDKWIEFPVFHEGFKLWYELNPETDNMSSPIPLDRLTKEQLENVVKSSPYYKSTAPDINWKERVSMQAVIQKYISHSISSTINLPEDVSVDEVSNIYFESWKQGLKGITVYRDGSRSGVLITKKEEKKEEFTQHNAPKRPKDLKCHVFITTSKGVKYNVFVGLLNEHPYEIFAVPYFTNAEELIIRKQGKGQYDLITDDGSAFIEDFLAELTDEEAAITRLISISLRHGANIKFVVEQLGKVQGNITGFVSAIKRILKRYVTEERIEKLKCDNCGSTNIRHEEGCNKCSDCGNSKCS